jgi:hypothetical protein
LGIEDESTAVVVGISVDDGELSATEALPHAAVSEETAIKVATLMNLNFLMKINIV